MTCKCKQLAPMQSHVSRYICAACSEEIVGPDPRDAEIARLKAEVASCRRHAVGVMAAGFNRALDEAGAPPAESPGLRVYAMRDEIARINLRVARLTSGSEAANLAGRVVEQDREIARLYRALAAGPAALRRKLPVDELPGVWDLIADAVEAAQEAAMKEEP